MLGDEVLVASVTMMLYSIHIAGIYSNDAVYTSTPAIHHAHNEKQTVHNNHTLCISLEAAIGWSVTRAAPIAHKCPKNGNQWVATPHVAAGPGP